MYRAFYALKTGRTMEWFSYFGHQTKHGIGTTSSVFRVFSGARRNDDVVLKLVDTNRKLLDDLLKAQNRMGRLEQEDDNHRKLLDDLLKAANRMGRLEAELKYSNTELMRISGRLVPRAVIEEFEERNYKSVKNLRNREAKFAYYYEHNVQEFQTYLHQLSVDFNINLDTSKPHGNAERIGEIAGRIYSIASYRMHSLEFDTSVIIDGKRFTCEESWFLAALCCSLPVAYDVVNFTK